MRTLVALTLLASLSLGEQLPFSVDSRIANGLVAAPNQFPYQVGLLITKLMKEHNVKVKTWCGGSLISDDTVLTAAHCLDDVLGADVFFGAHEIFKPDEPARVIMKVGPEHMVINEDYDRVTADNDIGLIKLPRKITLNAYIKTIKLPTLREKDMSYEKMVGVISGWGKMGDNLGQSPQLRFAQRTILRDKFCEFYYYGFKPSQICVDGRDLTSACPGDSGGPLVLNVDGEEVLIGLTSYGRIEGCEKGYPSVYTKVAYHLKWISANSNIQVRA